MAIKVPGALRGLQYVKETVYGVTPSTDFSYFGFMDALQDNPNNNWEEQQADGKRSYDEVEIGAREYGFDTTLNIFRDAQGYDWSEILQYAVGSSVNGITDDLPSFSALMQVSRDQFVLAKGCKIDSLTVAADGVGSPITARANIKAQYIPKQQASPSQFGNLGRQNEGPPKNTLTYNRYPTSNLPGMAMIPTKNFEISITNNLQPQEGIVEMGGEYFPLTAGQGLIPDTTEFEIQFEVVSTSAYWDNLKTEGTKDFTISQQIGNNKLTFHKCYLPGDDQPARSQSVYDEQITIKAADLTWERV